MFPAFAHPLVSRFLASPFDLYQKKAWKKIIGQILQPSTRKQFKKTF